MCVELSDEEAALPQELYDILESDRYPFSPRIRTLNAAGLLGLKESITHLIDGFEILAEDRNLDDAFHLVAGVEEQITLYKSKSRWQDHPYPDQSGRPSAGRG